MEDGEGIFGSIKSGFEDLSNSTSNAGSGLVDGT